MTPMLIALVLATSIAALTFVVGSVTAERADVRDSLRRLEGYQIQDVRDQEMLAPIARAGPHAVVGEPDRSRETVHAGRVRRGDRGQARARGKSRRTSTSTRSSS